MTWSLQPRNYTMAIRPNWYSIGYRRSGAYKGMGALGQGQCPGSPGCPGYVDPTTNVSNILNSIASGSGQYQVLSTDAYNQLLGQTVTQPAVTTNYLPWILGGVGVVLVLGMISGGRRR